MNYRRRIHRNKLSVDKKKRGIYPECPKISNIPDTKELPSFNPEFSKDIDTKVKCSKDIDTKVKFSTDEELNKDRIKETVRIIKSRTRTGVDRTVVISKGVAMFIDFKDELEGRSDKFWRDIRHDETIDSSLIEDLKVQKNNTNNDLLKKYYEKLVELYNQKQKEDRSSSLWYQDFNSIIKEIHKISREYKLRSEGVNVKLLADLFEGINKYLDTSLYNNDLVDENYTLDIFFHDFITSLNKQTTKTLEGIKYPQKMDIDLGRSLVSMKKKAVIFEHKEHIASYILSYAYQFYYDKLIFFQGLEYVYPILDIWKYSSGQSTNDKYFYFYNIKGEKQNILLHEHIMKEIGPETNKYKSPIQVYDAILKKYKDDIIHIRNDLISARTLNGFVTSLEKKLTKYISDKMGEDM